MWQWVGKFGEMEVLAKFVAWLSSCQLAIEIYGLSYYEDKEFADLAHCINNNQAVSNNKLCN